MHEELPSNSKYRKVLTKMLGIFRENPVLWNYLPGALPLFSHKPDSQENDTDYYGITFLTSEENPVFCYREGKIDNPLRRDRRAIPFSISSFIEVLQRFKMSLPELRGYFLEEIKEPLMGYEIDKAKIEQKTAKKLRVLEDRLV